MKRTTKTSPSWAALAALAAGCCAPQVQEPDQPGLQEPVPEDLRRLDPSAARAWLWPEPAPRAYVPPSDAQARAMTGLTRALFAAPAMRLADLRPLADAAGYEVEAWEVAGRRYLAARERPERRGGGGALVVRADVPAGPAVLLQAPHAFHDLGTERIALDLFFAAEDAWPRALFVNTIHRYLDLDGVKRKRDDAPADPCHNPGHLLALATAAAIEVLPDVEVLQLHGFDADRDDDPDPPAAIVSGGERPPSPRARAVAEALRPALARRVALFGDDIDRLGATTNVQGQVARARGAAARFVHIELAAGLRQELRGDPDLLRRFALALRAPQSP